MLPKSVFFVLALGFSQFLALPTEPEYAEVDFIENVLKKDVDAGPPSYGCPQTILYGAPRRHVSLLKCLHFSIDPSVDTRIVSGWQAYPGQLPHQCSLRMVGPLGDVSSCGGSVVHRNWVLTAAHCTATRVTLVIRAGVTDLTRPPYISESTEWYNYPTYNDFIPQIVQPDDISIVKMNQRIEFNHLVQPIRLQSRADAYRDYHGERTLASGFGRTWTNGVTPEVLNWVYLTAVSNPTCTMTFGAIITQNTVCARFFNITSQSTCQGDSGGPLVHVSADGEPTLIGVTSFVAGGDFGCHSGLPAGFIRVGPFHDWLTGITGLDFENLEEEETTEAPEVTTTPQPEETTTSAPEETTTPPPEESTEEPEDSQEETDDSKEDSEEKDSDSSESDDCELSELLKKLEVKVQVKVKVNKYKKVKK